jgi:hypothetical protein
MTYSSLSHEDISMVRQQNSLDGNDIGIQRAQDCLTEW